MHVRDGAIAISATDLSNFLACRHKTSLDLEVVRGRRAKPDRDDPVVALLRARGAEHEQRYVARLAEAGTTIVVIEEGTDRDAQLASTRRAMASGVDAIVQGALESGRWFGRADVLRRVDGTSRFGPWQYEAVDTKLAQETRAGTILQLCLYSWLLEEAQGAAPDCFHVVTPAAEERYRVAEYAAYVRLVRQAFLNDGLTGSIETYPEPTPHCDVCVWAGACNARRRADDHLSFVAGITANQRRELAGIAITTLDALGRTTLPAGFRPRRGSREVYDRVQDQARLQLQSRESGEPVFERLPVDGQLGLCRLPEPSAGDVFLDLESAAFARDGGREYLFGLSAIGDDGRDVYESRWAVSDAEERAAFEATIDRLMAAWTHDPAMHIYHYGAYEPAALKRMMGRHSTRAIELDHLLRAERFVDLYAIVRHALRAGVESYSIKSLEAFSGYRRAVALAQASDSRRTIEHALEMATPDAITPDDRDIVEGYNRDDCVSTRRLREWLEALRTRTIADGVDVPRCPPKEAPQEEPKPIDLEVEQLRERLLATLPVDRESWSDADRGRHLLAYLIDWHRREDKAAWWEYFRLRDLAPDDLMNETKALAGLQFVERVRVKKDKRSGKPTGAVTDRYAFPRQDFEFSEGQELSAAASFDFGTVIAVDRDARTIDIEKTKKCAEDHPPAVFAFMHVRNESVQRGVMAYARSLLERNGVVTDCRDALLYRRPPVLRHGTLDARDGEPAVDVAKRVAPELEASVLAIQGPPGAGKTYTGARMICALVRAGKRVGVAAHSHKVIRNLLDAVLEQAGETPIAIAHRCKEPSADAGAILEVVRSGKEGNSEARELLQRGRVQLLAGTAWLWAAESDCDPVDVLFVDEAGQMSLADTIALGRAAKSLVLLGDQQQLEQPQKAAHPDGVDISALDHVLGGAKTVPEGHGLFLPVTWRLSPPLAAFTSELFYESKLEALPSLSRQSLRSGTAFRNGLYLVPVPHRGNQSASDEEAACVKAIVTELLDRPSTWIDKDGVERPMTASDIRVITPYNAQVARISHALAGLDVPVGTVDKFQGQEATVAIYSMASSSPDEAPRGMEFLYDLHRFNVATSRGRCACIVVASPELLEPDCRTPRQIQLANALCRYRELAAVVAPAASTAPVGSTE